MLGEVEPSTPEEVQLPEDRRKRKRQACKEVLMITGS
jgi:hypothetical protein